MSYNVSLLKVLLLFFKKARIHQKEETVHKYQELLRQARDDMAASNKRNEEEIRLMQDKVNHWLFTG